MLPTFRRGKPRQEQLSCSQRQETRFVTVMPGVLCFITQEQFPKMSPNLVTCGLSPCAVTLRSDHSPTLSAPLLPTPRGRSKGTGSPVGGWPVLSPGFLSSVALMGTYCPLEPSSFFLFYPSLFPLLNESPVYMPPSI